MPRHDRVLGDIEKLIAEHEAKLANLKDARRSILNVMGEPPKRRTAPLSPEQPSTPTPPIVKTNTEKSNGTSNSGKHDQQVTSSAADQTILDLLKTLLSDRAEWSVEDAFKKVKALGKSCTRAAVNTALHRQSQLKDGAFERIGQGRYRLRSSQGGDQARAK